MAKKKKSTAATKSSKRKTKPATHGKPRLYTLDVFLADGLITAKFAKKNRIVSRTIQIRGDQTLEDLHIAIFEAFDRFDEHMYEFQFGKRQMDGPRYVMPWAAENSDGHSFVGIADQTTIESLHLKEGKSFWYWFDFGDDWWHQINVEAIEPDIPAGKYPKLIKRVGESPPQYLDPDDDES